MGVRQRVEILKALYRKSDILVLDEPSAVLTLFETEELFGIIRGLAEAGTTVIFITHKLNEVLEVADRITVLRRGRVAGTVAPTDATREILANLMVGRDVELRVAKGPASPGRRRALDQGPPRARRPGAHGREGREPGGPGGRDRRARGRPGQRPDRAHRGDRGPPVGGLRRDRHRRPRHHVVLAPPRLGPRCRARARGPDARRPHRRDDRGRELHPRHVSPRALQHGAAASMPAPSPSARPPPWRTTTSARRRSRPLRARSRAATSRRWSWRGSSPGP